jgi:hypothetical protein
MYNNIPQKFHSRIVMVTDSVKTDEWKGQKDLQQRETSSEEAVVRLVFVLIWQEGWQIRTFLYYYPAAPPPNTHTNHSYVTVNGSELIIYYGY